jgi:hypothetical protein
VEEKKLEVNVEKTKMAVFNKRERGRVKRMSGNGNERK